MSEIKKIGWVAGILVILLTAYGGTLGQAPSQDSDKPRQDTDCEKCDQRNPVKVSVRLIKGSGPAVFLVVAGHRRWIPDERTFDALGLDWKAVETISDEQLNGFPKDADYPALSGRLVKGSGPAIYLLENGKRRWIPDEQTFEKLRLNSGDIQTISDQDLRLIPRGANMPK